MNQNRILELAVKELERQRVKVKAEIEAIQAELKRSVVSKRPKPAAGPTAKRRIRTLAQPKAHSHRMKKIWAVKRATAAKAKKAKTPTKKAATA